MDYLLIERHARAASIVVVGASGDSYRYCQPAPYSRRISVTAPESPYQWLHAHLPRDQCAVVTDVTSAESVLTVMGPRSREFLQSLTGADLSNGACPFGHWVELELGYVRVRALRMTYVGELGWELYLPTEQAVNAFDTLMARDDAPCPAGFHALHSLRTESAYRHWGHDISDEDDPLAAGLGFAVVKDKDFIGREAVDALRDQPRSRRLVSLRLEDPEPLLYHDEPVYLGDRIVGRTTSGRYGHTVAAAVALAWIEHPESEIVDNAFLEENDFHVEVAAEPVKARLSLRPFHDPERKRVKG